MLCPSCKTDVPSNASFCPKCGGRLGDAVSAPAAASAAPSGAAAVGLAPRGAAAAAEPDRELWKGSYSPKAMIGWWILEGVLVVAAVVASIFLPTPITWIAAAVIVAGFGLWLLLWLAIRRLSLEYALTTHQLTHREGLLRRVTNRIETIDIDDVTHEQNLVERFLGVGSILVVSSDKSHPRLILIGIDDVQRVADLINNTSREERRKRGAFIEQV
jgi:membrane protein YdbS with pleckstrin-like domain